MDRDTNLDRIAQVQRQLAEVAERIERERALMGRLQRQGADSPRTRASLAVLLRRKDALQRELDDLRTWLGKWTRPNTR